MDRKPEFRDAFRTRRCLLPADGFPVWDEEGRRREIRHRDPDRVLAFAGIWDRWEPEEAGSGTAPVESCAMITVPANELVARFQERMPAIVDEEGRDAWLDPETDPEDAKAQLRIYPSEKLRVVAGAAARAGEGE